MFAIKYRKIFLGIAAAVMLSSVATISIFGLNLGIDFTGGSLSEVAYSEEQGSEITEDAVTAALRELGLDLGGLSLRESTLEDGREGFILRTRDLTEAERISVHETLTEVLPEGEVVRFTSIGPVIGEELKDKALWAIAGVAIIIILYVAFAFSGVGKPVGSFVYGGITILALIHDVLVPAALVSILGVLVGLEIDVLFVMAILAVLGYSVNDTIVVFDRVRENLLQYRQEHRTRTAEAGVTKEEVSYTFTKPFEEIVGMSVSQTIVRSINTSVTTLLALSALYFFGGEVTQTFSLVLIAGVIAGTYSSIFLANPLLVYIAGRKVKETSNS